MTERRPRTYEERIFGVREEPQRRTYEELIFGRRSDQPRRGDKCTRCGGLGALTMHSVPCSPGRGP
jgi:hypothetical protein